MFAVSVPNIQAGHGWGWHLQMKKPGLNAQVFLGYANDRSGRPDESLLL
jgi:hypothetical protein